MSIKCKLKGHNYVTWEHPGDGNYDRSRFFIGKALLKNPECSVCGHKKFTSKKEEYLYRQQLKKEKLL